MNAKERFEATRDAVKRLHDVKLLIMYDCDDWKPQNVKSAHETSDPTASRAIYAVDELSDKLEALRKEETELQTQIGETLAIIQSVRDGLGEEYAALLEARYIDCFAWVSVKSILGWNRNKGYRLLLIAFDWIDSIGVSRLLAGDYEL